ncbi:MAG: helix-turn-helix transcriptional regulator, partial [Clostridiales bacterium]|nr:helix-turn-helix transcriptional regulator [Clostridiales bacterium]
MLGSNIKKLRNQKKLTQAELAEIFDVTQTTVANWERGFRTPDLETLTNLANYFGVTLDSLVGRNTIPFPDKKESSPSSPPLTMEERLKQPIAYDSDGEREPVLEEDDFEVIAAHSESGGLTP